MSDRARAGEVAFHDIGEFLAGPALREILELVAHQESQFRETGVPGVRVLPALPGDEKRIADGIRALLPRACERLGVPPISRPGIDSPVAAVGHGGKLEIAAMTPGPHAAGLSYVLTFFESPRRFTGGALILENPHDRDVRITLPAANGRMLFFPDSQDLEISRVQSDSREFRHSLFVMTASIRRGSTIR